MAAFKNADIKDLTAGHNTVYRLSARPLGSLTPGVRQSLEEIQPAQSGAGWTMSCDGHNKITENKNITLEVNQKNGMLYHCFQNKVDTGHSGEL